MTNIVDDPWALRYNQINHTWEDTGMLADIAEKYFLEGDFNCAESVLLAVADGTDEVALAAVWAAAFCAARSPAQWLRWARKRL